MSKKNKRCPLQVECGYTCEHVGGELGCDYYKNNGFGDKSIPDQEEIREKLELVQTTLLEEELMDQIDLEEKQLVYIDIDKLNPHPDNPRKELGDLTELAESIKSKGIMQNLTVVPYYSHVHKRVMKGLYTVIIGHRRCAAARLAGLTQVPCVIVEMSPQEQVATMLLENIQRSDLTVYEQAQGFQMMLDLGEDVGSIAEKTGFSKSTVRRRLKIAELDQKVLQEVSGRQISLLDFEKLEKIEDLGVRNAVLKSIGTPNFNQSLEREIKKQNITKTLPWVKEEIKKLKATKIKYSETYSGKYSPVTDQIRFYERDTDQPLLESDIAQNAGKLYYLIDEDYGTVRFYKEVPEAKPVKRSKKEIDREKYIAETRDKFTALTADMYKLRSDFIATVKPTKNNSPEILQGAVIANALRTLTWVYTSSEHIYDIVGLKRSESAYENHVDKALALIQNEPTYYPAIIYAAFGDDAKSGYFGGYNKEFPTHEKNMKLDALYEWLISLGYELSDEEKQLRDGTHPLFIDKDAKEGV